MVRDGTVSGDMYGDRIYHDRVSFAQGAAGAGLNFVKKDTDVWYVDSGKTGPASSGDGTTWDKAFLTLKEAVTASGDYDTILVAPNSIQTIASGGIVITQIGLRILGANGSSRRQSAALKMIAGTDPMFTITADRVEIAGLNLSCRVAYPVICIGSVTLGVGTAVYSTWIHDNNIDGAGTGTFGVAMGGAGGFGVATQCDAVQTVIEHNDFGQFATACVVVSGSRMSVLNNSFNVVVDTIGVSVVETAGNRQYWSVNDNYFTGIANSSTHGIAFAGNTTLGSGTVMNNLFVGSWDTTVDNNTGDVGCMNYTGTAAGGTLLDFNTSA